MNYDEAFEVLEREVQRRYDTDAFDFLAAFSDGVAEQLFPGADDLIAIAEAMDRMDEVEFEDENVI